MQTGERVQLHPATDAWMRGDRYGTIAEARCGTCGRRGHHPYTDAGHPYTDPTMYVVVMDRSGRTLRVVPANVLPIE